MFDQFLWIYVIGYIFDLMHLNNILISSTLDLCLCLFLFRLYALEHILYRMQGSFISAYCYSCSEVLFYYIVALVIAFFVLPYICILNYIIGSMQLSFFLCI